MFAKPGVSRPCSLLAQTIMITCILFYGIKPRSAEFRVDFR